MAASDAAERCMLGQHLALVVVELGGGLEHARQYGTRPDIERASALGGTEALPVTGGRSDACRGRLTAEGPR
jgi:hypothetical protein